MHSELASSQRLMSTVNNTLTSAGDSACVVSTRLMNVHVYLINWHGKKGFISFALRRKEKMLLFAPPPTHRSSTSSCSPPSKAKENTEGHNRKCKKKRKREKIAKSSVPGIEPNPFDLKVSPATHPALGSRIRTRHLRKPLCCQEICLTIHHLSQPGQAGWN